MSDFLQDLRFGIKNLLRNPGFALVAILTLGLGIGTNGAIFSVVDTVLFRSYPYKDPEQLMMLRMANNHRGGDEARVSYPDFDDIRQRSKSFGDMAAALFTSLNLSGGEEPIRVRGAKVSPNVFALVGCQPLLGRTFLPNEIGASAPKVAILSDTVWHRSFAGDPSILGKPIRLDGESYTLVGIVPSTAQWPDVTDTEVFIPIDLEPTTADRAERSFMVLARLKPGVPVAQARQDLSGLARMTAQEHPESNEGWSYQALTLREFRTRSDRSLLLFSQAAVAFVLLIACLNVANLLLQRFTVRNRELTLRAALGANRGRMMRQLVTEAVPLALLGAVTGAFISQLLLKLIVSMLPPDDLPIYLRQFSMNPRVLGFLLLVSVVTVLFFGLAPALRFSNPNLTKAIGEGGRSAGGRHRQRLRNLLVISEVALSLILLIAASLMIKSFQNLLRVDPGFQPDRLVAVEMSLPEKQYAEPFKRLQLYQELLTRVQAVPGIEHVAAGTQLPFGGWSGSDLTLDGQTEQDAKSNPPIGTQLVLGDYFQTVGLPLLKGRLLGGEDESGPARAVIVNDKLARRLWPKEDPLGKRIRLSITEDAWLTVVGVVGNTKRRGLKEDTGLDAYLPFAQVQKKSLALLARTTGPSSAVFGQLREQIQAVNPDLPVNIIDMRKLIDDSVSVQRVASMLFGLFGGLALLLAAIGLYGVMSYSISQRTHEIGIRMAIGGSVSDVLRLVVKQSLQIVGIGIAIGLAGAFALTLVMSKLLFEVSPADPLVLVGVTAVMAVTALLASVIPARRAAGVNPVVALRYE